MKKLFYLIITLAFGVIIYASYKELFELKDLIIKGSLYRWLFLALLFNIAAYFFNFFAHKKALELFGIKRSLKKISQLTLSSLAINSSGITLGNLGSIVFYEEASKEKKESKISAVIATFVVMAADTISFSLLLIFSFFYLSQYEKITFVQLVAVLVFFLITLLYVLIPLISLKNKNMVENLFNKIKDLVNYFREKKNMSLLANNWSTNITNEVSIAIKVILEKPFKSLDVFILLIINHLINITVVYFVFLSYNAKPSLGMAAAAYAVAILFKIASPTPEGIGFAESAMAISIISFGFSSLTASAIAITFRGLNFWIPSLIGFFILHHNQIFKNLEKK